MPKEVWWDNPKTVATLILQGRERQLHPRYAALASHYAFDPAFCMPARGNEKPDAERTVKAVQRRFATPVPRVADLDELNTFFRKRCEAERDRVVQSLFGPFAIKDRLAEDLAAAAPLPAHRFDPCVIQPGGRRRQVSDRRLRRQPLQRPPAVRVPDGDGQGLRRPGRDRGATARSSPRTSGRSAKQTMILDPLHYLATLDRKPGALDHAPVFRDWKLPACFAAFRADLEREHGAMAGARRFVRVLQLLGEHPLARVTRSDRSLPARVRLDQRRGRDPADAGRWPRSRPPAAVGGDISRARPRRLRSTSRSPT